MPNHSLLEEIKLKKIKFNGVSSDSRSIKKGNIFFAIPGNEIDGSRFINQAIKKGAAAIVVPSYSKKRYPNENISKMILNWPSLCICIELIQKTLTWYNFE